MLGAKGLDKKGISYWDGVNFGDIIWDKKLNLAPQENQLYIYNFCNDLKQGDLVYDEQITCWMMDFREWVLAQGNAFPVDEEDFEIEVTDFLSTVRGTELKSGAFVGQVDGKVQWTMIRISTPVVVFSVSKVKKPWYNKYQKLKS